MQEYALAMGIYLTIIRCGSISTNYLTPLLANKELGNAFLLGLIFLIMSFISGIIFIFLEKRAIKTDNLRSSVNLRQTFRLRLIRRFDTQFWLV